VGNVIGSNLCNLALIMGLCAVCRPLMASHAVIRREVSPSPRSRSRFDLLVEAAGRRTFVEVKSVTLKEGDAALFPDAVTVRGKKHLDALARLPARGCDAVILYVARRTDCTRFAPARAIDPIYARALGRALRAGVRAHCIVASIDEAGLYFAGALPVGDA